MKKVFIAANYDGDCFVFSVKPVYTNGRYYSEGGAEAKLSVYVAEALGIPLPKPGKMIEWPPPSQVSASEPEPAPGPPQIEKVCGTCKWDCAVCPTSVEKYVRCGVCCAFSHWEPMEISETDKNADECKPEPEPPAETLVPITSFSQLKVGDRVRVRTATLERTVLGILGCSVALSCDRFPDRFGTWWTLEDINNARLGQVVTTAPRTLSREEARKAIDEGKKVRSVDSDFWYCLSDEKTHFISGKVTDMRGIRWSANIKAFDIPEGRYEIVKIGK